MRQETKGAALILIVGGLCLANLAMLSNPQRLFPLKTERDLSPEYRSRKRQLLIVNPCGIPEPKLDRMFAELNGYPEIPVIGEDIVRIK